VHHKRDAKDLDPIPTRSGDGDVAITGSPDHLVRKTAKAIGLEFIRERVAHRHVFLGKYFLQFLLHICRNRCIKHCRLAFHRRCTLSCIGLLLDSFSLAPCKYAFGITECSLLITEDIL